MPLNEAEREVCEVIITGGDADWLTDFTRRLVEARLAACGHISTPIRSIYRWAGAVRDEPEARVALHTRRSLVPRIVRRTDEEHAYEVPCVIAVPIVAGNPDYTQWILDSTDPPGTA